ncbi:MAG: EamA family transporter [Candidatus Aenigmarchaeota archaeon]|nr:EamA family transporter [Candidatus Aenigmarchaeota archaeon]
MIELWVISLVVLSTILGAFGSLFFKFGSEAKSVKKLFFNRNFLAGMVLFVVATVLGIIALKFGELSKIFPITSLTYVWVAFISAVFLKERITKHKLLALLFIVVGIILITG